VINRELQGKKDDNLAPPTSTNRPNVGGDRTRARYGPKGSPKNLKGLCAYLRGKRDAGRWHEERVDGQEKGAGNKKGKKDGPPRPW